MWDNSTQQFNVETLKQEKTTGEQNLLYSGCTSGDGYNTPFKVWQPRMTLNVRCCTQLWCCSLFFLSLSRRAVYYSHTRTLLSKCISNAGLLASTVAHTAMAPLSFLLLPLTSCYLLQSHTHTTQLTFCSATSSVCSRHFETNMSYGLFTSVAPTPHHYYSCNYNNISQ